MTASLHGPKFQFGFPFSLLNLPHLLAPGLRAQVMLPGLLPESPTPIKAIFFKQLSQLSNPSQWWTNPKKWIWKARYLPYSALTLTSPCPVLDGWLSCVFQAQLCAPTIRALIQLTTTCSLSPSLTTWKKGWMQGPCLCSQAKAEQQASVRTGTGESWMMAEEDDTWGTLGLRSLGSRESKPSDTTQKWFQHRYHLLRKGKGGTGNPKYFLHRNEISLTTLKSKHLCK